MVTREDNYPDEWIWVDKLQPVDLSNIQDKGMKGAVMLAVALGWNLVQRRDAPAQLVSRGGLTRNIPTDTGVRQSVFWSVIANIVAHSEGRLPTADLIERIVKQSGMSKAHAQVLTSKVTNIAERVGLNEQEAEETEPVDPWALPTAEQIQEIFAPREPEPEPEPEPAVVEEVATGNPVEPSEYPTMRVEPTLNHMGDGNQYLSPIMETIIRRLIPDGEDQITYRCLKCGLEFPSKRSVGSHWQTHVKAGEAEATAARAKTVVNKVEGYQPTEVHAPRTGLGDENRRLRRIIRDVQAAVGQEAIKEAERRVEVLQRKLAAAEAESARLKQRNEALERSLNTLHELLGEIKESK